MRTPEVVIRDVLLACGVEGADRVEAPAIMANLDAEGYKIVVRNPCGCGCGNPKGKHLCPCGCGHTYEDAVRKVMGGSMYLNWEQASANIDEHPHISCKW